MEKMGRSNGGWRNRDHKSLVDQVKGYVFLSIAKGI